MLTVQLIDQLFLNNYLIALLFLTTGFFKYSTVSLHIKAISTEKNKMKSKCAKKNYNFIFIKFIIVVLSCLLSQILLYRGYSEIL